MPFATGEYRTRIHTRHLPSLTPSPPLQSAPVKRFKTQKYIAVAKANGKRAAAEKQQAKRKSKRKQTAAVNVEKKTHWIEIPIPPGK